MKTIQIGQRRVGGKEPTFVIAEIGINHGGDPAVARKLVDSAAAAGADAVKFQTYVTEKRVAQNSPIYDILKKCELSHEAQLDLKDRAEGKGVTFFSTPFDDESVDFLVKAGVKLFKIASFDIVNLALLRKVASTGSPAIVSRGMADAAEIERAVGVLREHQIPFALLHCVSSYPTPRHDANLGVIRTLSDRYDCPVGYSDHTLGPDVPVLAVAAGARVIEKHFTLDKAEPGPDHAMSADPAELAEMVRRIRDVELILGKDELRTYEAEKGTLQYRRPTA